MRRHSRRRRRRASRSDGITEWADRLSYRDRIDERMHRFHGSTWNVYNDDPTLRASHYPSAVALARLLASPDWKALALHPEGSATFVDEVRQTVEPRRSSSVVPQPTHTTW